MKRKRLLPLSWLLVGLLGACDPIFGSEPTQYSAYEPVLMARASLEQSIKAGPARDIADAGKIYLYNNLVLINERYQGIHVIDNSNPEKPVNRGFVAVPGSQDIAVNKGILYADNGVDLVAISFQDLQQTKVTKRIKNAFPELLPPDGLAPDTKYAQANRPPDTVVVGWVKKPQQ